MLNFGAVIVALTTCGTGMLGGSITEGLTAFRMMCRKSKIWKARAEWPG